VIAESENLTADQKRDEAIMLGIRMREGLLRSDLSSTQIQTLSTYGENGFVEMLQDRVLLTPTGRLIADRIVRELTF
jgi:oxygen-independent coproporphyrinogen-3 oxidase